MSRGHEQAIRFVNESVIGTNVRVPSKTPSANATIKRHLAIASSLLLSISLLLVNRIMPFSSTRMAFLGLLVSLYAVYVEYKMANKSPEEEFSALCDIDQIGASCR